MAYPVQRHRSQVTSGNDSNGSLTGSDNGKLGGLLEPVRTDPSSASVIKDRNLTIAKGTFIDCILQTRLDTTVPGMASCVHTEKRVLR